MPAETMIAPGFSDPVFQSQAAFRALLAALSEPGTLQQVAGEITPPEGLTTATATALLTLADYETPVWLPEAIAWIHRRHAGLPATGNCASIKPGNPLDPIPQP